MDHAHHTGATDPGHNLVAPEAFKLVGHGGRGPVHVVKELGRGMEVLPPSFDIGMQVGDAVDDGHLGGSSIAAISRGSPGPAAAGPQCELYATSGQAARCRAAHSGHPEPGLPSPMSNR